MLERAVHSLFSGMGICPKCQYRRLAYNCTWDYDPDETDDTFKTLTVEFYCMDCKYQFSMAQRIKKE